MNVIADKIEKILSNWNTDYKEKGDALFVKPPMHPRSVKRIALPSCMANIQCISYTNISAEQPSRNATVERKPKSICLFRQQTPNRFEPIAKG